MYKVEICTNSAESCLAAQEGGADRVELCANILEGGTTPSFGEIDKARELLTRTQLFVIIRPRGGDFLYNKVEADIMERDITLCRDVAEVEGVVFGCLNTEGEIDIPLMERLMKASKGLSVTFHRAFDQCIRPFEALEQLIDLGVDRILTSGQQPTAEQGIPFLKELVEKAGDRIIILPGSGITENNIARIAKETGAKEFHFSARERQSSGMVYRNTTVPMSVDINADPYIKNVTTAARVKRTIEKLKG